MRPLLLALSPPAASTAHWSAVSGVRAFLLLALGLCACRDPAPPAPPRAEAVASASAPASAGPSAESPAGPSAESPAGPSAESPAGPSAESPAGPSAQSPAGPSARPLAGASAEPPAAPAPAPEAHPGPPSAERYPWLAEPNLEPKAVETLRTRFPPPPGFRRVVPVPKSFGEWLGDLPLAEAGTPVRAFDGRVLHPATDKRIAAVVALDVSRADLQQCADTVIRLHAEWRWSQGARDMSYRAAAGVELPWSRWAAGERIVPKGASIQWVPGSQAVDDHASFRKYLDAVFAWANTVSLEKQGKQVLPADLRAGDFFILPGNPGHVVLVLDVAKGRERVALLGQSFMPAQNMQVLRAPDGGPWFHVDPSKDVDTPFWKPFPWSSLRRLPE